ncbi:hypothetical protein [Methylobacterium sp. J-068]|uniref:hypothetical protein n=1 Tax=Methylobacterium sp. J-068 TaxID=2836649 RepID=UPI001FB8BBA3|nr:hypothetical protein [Methylobacterium sp. J-068]MCJ2037119.1 hypothetical protein [Methylobacterium sp. J-068]
MTAPVAPRLLFAAIAGAVLTLSSASFSTAQAGGCGGAECYRHVNTPPVYGAVSERVLVRPAETVYRTIPPVYETVSERILVAPGGRVWQTRRDAYGELIGCWVNIPPQYSVRHRRVLVQPAQSIPETIPAEYASVRRRVLVQPARSGWVPANYGQGGYPGAYGPSLVGSLPDALGIAGASSADVGVGLGFSSGSIYDGY